MPPDEAGLGSPAEWLAYARSDLILARRGQEPGVLLETLCFHAQQAAEKSIKAVLVHHGVFFPATHNLTLLVELLPPGSTPPPDAENVAMLSAYAVAARYPLGRDEVSEDDYREALALAGNVAEELAAMKVELAAEPLKVRYVPDDEALAKCCELGRTVAEKLKEKCAA